ncbi:MAG: hypothetical protein WC091_13720 [Sulfuricellaceae bacterium]
MPIFHNPTRAGEKVSISRILPSAEDGARLGVKNIGKPYCESKSCSPVGTFFVPTRLMHFPRGHDKAVPTRLLLLRGTSTMQHYLFRIEEDWLAIYNFGYAD